MAEDLPKWVVLDTEKGIIRCLRCGTEEDFPFSYITASVAFGTEWAKIHRNCEEKKGVEGEGSPR